jgi:hypothetical protein
LKESKALSTALLLGCNGTPKSWRRVNNINTAYFRPSPHSAKNAFERADIRRKATIASLSSSGMLEPGQVSALTSAHRKQSHTIAIKRISHIAPRPKNLASNPVAISLHLGQTGKRNH